MRLRSLWFAALLAGSSSAALASLPQPAPRIVRTSVSVDAVLAEIKTEERWRERVATPTPEFRDAVVQNFSRWQELLTRLSGERRHDEADRIVQALIALRAAWGDKLVPLDRYDAFIRDRFLVGTHQIDAAQFFAPTPLYSGERGGMKLLRFSVYEGDRVVARYYLERSDVAGKLNVLTCKSIDGKHRQVQPYGNTAPSYWELKRRVISDLRDSSVSAPSAPSAPRRSTR